MAGSIATISLLNCSISTCGTHPIRHLISIYSHRQVTTYIGPGGANKEHKDILTQHRGSVATSSEAELLEVLRSTHNPEDNLSD
jgi:hypothetical protein